VKKDFFISLMAFLIFGAVNLSFGLLNILENNELNTTTAIECLVFQALFCLLVWILSQIKISVRKSIRMPIIRSLFWLWIAYPLLGDNNISQIASGDFIVAVLPFFCFYLNLLEPLFEDFSWFTYILVVYIVGIAMYQILVLEISKFAIDRFGKN